MVMFVKLSIHPDANTNPDVKWSDTITGRAMALANADTSLDLKNRWSHSEKRLVPLEASVADAIRTDLNAGGRSLIHHVTTALTSTSEVPTVDGGPPYCDHHTQHTSATGTLLSAFLILSHHNVPIHVLIDSGCIQTNVVSERVANLIRQDGGKLRPANVVLISGVGGSYAVQGFISMTVALPAPDTSVKYRHIFEHSIVSKDVTSDLIIGLPSIKYFHFLPILQYHLASQNCCQLCTHSVTRSITVLDPL